MSKDDNTEYPFNADPSQSTSAEAARVAEIRGEEVRSTSAEAEQQRELDAAADEPKSTRKGKKSG